MGVVDELAPLAEFTNNTIKTTNTPMAIRTKEYLRKRLLKQKKNKPTNVLSERIKMLDSEIKIYYHGLC